MASNTQSSVCLFSLIIVLVELALIGSAEQELDLTPNTRSESEQVVSAVNRRIKREYYGDESMDVPSNVDQGSFDSVGVLGTCSGWRRSTLLGFAPGGSMGSYTLAASLSLNVCWVLFFASVSLARGVSSRLADKYPTALAFRNLTEDYPWVIGKCVTEQLGTVMLILTTIGLLASTDISSYPFYGSSCTDIISLVYSANIGRYVFRILQDVYLCEHVKKWWINLVHHVVAIFCYSTMIYHGQNLFLGAFGILMEGSSFPLDILWGFKFLDIEIHQKFYVFFAILALVLTILLRFVLPLIAVVCACLAQSPLGMHPVPLAALFLAGVFFTAINVSIVYSSQKKIKKHKNAQKREHMESVVVAKVPDLINMPKKSHTKRNILPTGDPLVDSLAQRNCADGAIYFNNLTEPDKKTDKTPFNMGLLMQYQKDWKLSEHSARNEASGVSATNNLSRHSASPVVDLDAEFTDRRNRYLREGSQRSGCSSSSSSDVFIRDNEINNNRVTMVTSQVEINLAGHSARVNLANHSAVDDSADFEEISLASV